MFVSLYILDHVDQNPSFATETNMLGALDINASCLMRNLEYQSYKIPSVDEFECDGTVSRVGVVVQCARVAKVNIWRVQKCKLTRSADVYTHTHTHTHWPRAPFGLSTDLLSATSTITASCTYVVGSRCRHIKLHYSNLDESKARGFNY